MIILLAAMLATQQPAAADGADLHAVVKKPKDACAYIEVSGSRMRKRVCSDANGMAERDPGVTDSLANPGMAHAMPGPAKGGLGGTPK